MAGFLSEAWFEEMAAAGRAASVDDSLRLTVQQVVTGVPDQGDVAYVVEIRDGTIDVRRGHAVEPDLRFTQDHATALAVHRGELAAQAAFIAGRLRVGGDLSALLVHARTLAEVDDVFGGARA